MDAVQGLREPAERLLVVVTGDIARTGKSREYDAAAGFLTELAAGLEESFGALPEFFVVPGNHDCDLACSDSIRQVLLERYQSGADLDGLMLSKCLEPLEAFRAFVQELAGVVECHGCDQVVAEWRSSIDSISLLLLNSAAWYHRASQPGQFRFLLPALDNVAEPASQVRMALIHHPYAWFEPSNARELRARLESTCDVVFTGHEHQADSYLKSRSDLERSLFVEGGILQDPEGDDASTFNVVRVTDTREYQVTTLGWSDGRYAPLAEPVRHSLLGTRAAARRTFIERADFSSILDDAGADFRHPRKKQVLLGDIFVYPEYQRLSETNKEVPTILSGRGLLGIVQESKKVLVLGEEKAGKTTAARMLFRDCREAGKVPLLLSPDDFRPLKTLDRTKAWLSSIFSREYLRPKEYQYWQLPPDNRALIVDDFDELSLSNAARSRLLAWWSEMFGAVVLFAAQDFRLRELVDSEAGEPLSGFLQLQLVEFGYVARHRLVSRWCSLGRDASYTEANLHVDCIRKEQLLASVLGRNLIPSWPLFLLIMLQQLEIRSTPDSSVASFGRLYGAVITSSLAAVSEDAPDLESKLNYLTVFSWKLFQSGVDCLDHEDFHRWHDEYCGMFAVALSVDRLLLAMDAACMLVQWNGAIRFRYRYCYQFFVAKYLAENIREDQVRAAIQSLGGSLDQDDSANILVFLCHLCKDELVLDVVLSKAAELFASEAEFDVGTPPSFLAAGSVRLPALAVEATSPQQNLERMLEQQDRGRGGTLGQEGSVSITIAEESDSEIIRWLRDVAVAKRVVQIAGQILRNYYGTMRAEQQAKIMRSVYSLGLRTLSGILGLIAEHHQELVEALADRIAERLGKRASSEGETKRRSTKPDRAELEDRVAKLVGLVVDLVTFGSVKEVSNAVGLDRLRLTLDRVAAAPSNLSYELIDTSVRLDYFDDFPESRVIDLARKAKSARKVFALAQLRYLVWHHFHLYYRDYRTVQTVCSELGITVSPGRFLLSGGKRFSRDD